MSRRNQLAVMLARLLSTERLMRKRLLWPTSPRRGKGCSRVAGVEDELPRMRAKNRKRKMRRRTRSRHHNRKMNRKSMKITSQWRRRSNGKSTATIARTVET